MAHLLPATLPRLPGITFCIFVMAFVYTQQSARAAESVTGKYLSATGTSVVLSLSMQKPSPANLIVEQYLAPGNKIAATSPRAKKSMPKGEQ